MTTCAAGVFCARDEGQNAKENRRSNIPTEASDLFVCMMIHKSPVQRTCSLNDS
jgi:hypothetical protein